MKITNIDLFKADIKLKEPFRIAVMVQTVADNIFVRVQTDAGISGWGETSPCHKLCGETQPIDWAAGIELASAIKGKNALAIEDRISEMDAKLKNNSQIRAAFDMALYDIASRAAKMPLFRFLGGAGRPMRTCLTIPIFAPQEMAQKAAAAAERGFGIIKIKLGTTVKEDIERVRLIRKAVGPDVALRVDANQGWDVPAGVAVLNAIHELGVEYCEQPVPYWNVPAMKQVHDRSPIPIVADEGIFDHHDAMKVFAADAADYVNIKLAKSGGIRCGQRVASVADAAGKACMIGCMMESRLGLTAAAHFAASMKCFRFYDLDTALLLAEDPIVGGMRYEKDQVVLDEAAGMGVEVDAKFLEKCERVTI